MRWLVPLVLLMLVSPVTCATSGIAPAMTLRIEPSAIELNNSSMTQTAVFNCTLSVNKIPKTKFNASVTSSVDTGWPSVCSPSEMDLTTETTQNFTCTVTVPPGTGGLIGAVKIDARGQGSGFVAIASAQSIVAVSGPPKNQTGGGGNQSGTINNTGNDPVFTAPASSGPAFDRNTMLAVSVMLLFGVIGVVVIGRRRSGT